jgi:type IV secretion system protein VirB11
MNAQEQIEKEKQERLLRNLFSDMEELIPYLEDGAVTDIAVQDSGEIIVTRFGKGREFTNTYLSAMTTQRIILAATALLGRKLDTQSGFPVLEGIIPKYNARITGMMPPNLMRPEISIRKPPEEVFTLENYVETGRMTSEQYETVVQYITERKNLVISGSTGSGKTTFTNAVIKKMEELSPSDNFYMVEDIPELQCKARMKTGVWVSKEHAARAVEEALRWNPDRIIFGEVRNGRVMKELLDAWETGHEGNVTTVHADNCLSTLRRIRGLLRRCEDADDAAELSDVIHLIVHLRKTKDGIRVDEIMPVKEDTDSFMALIEQNGLG